MLHQLWTRCVSSLFVCSKARKPRARAMGGYVEQLDGRIVLSHMPPSVTLADIPGESLQLDSKNVDAVVLHVDAGRPRLKELTIVALPGTTLSGVANIELVIDGKVMMVANATTGFTFPVKGAARKAFDKGEVGRVEFDVSPNATDGEQIGFAVSTLTFGNKKTVVHSGTSTPYTVHVASP